MAPTKIYNAMSILLLGTALALNPSHAYGYPERPADKPPILKREPSFKPPVKENRIFIDSQCELHLDKFRDANIRDLEKFLLVSDYSKKGTDFFIEGRKEPYYELFNECYSEFLTDYGIEKEPDFFQPLFFYSDFEDRFGNDYLIIEDRLNNYSVLFSKEPEISNAGYKAILIDPLKNFNEENFMSIVQWFIKAVELNQLSPNQKTH